jgi:hypothetical protein
MLTVANPQPAISQTVVLSLTVAGEETAVAANNRFNLLDLVFVDPDEGDDACFLCYADWLLKLLGFEPSFWMLHHMSLTDLQASLSWDYYTSFIGQNSSELSTILATNPTILWQTLDALETWTPAVQTYDDGQGSAVIVSQAMVDEAKAALEDIRDAADPDLAARIQVELDLLDIESYAGLTMDEVATRVMDRVQSVTYLPIVFSQ